MNWRLWESRLRRLPQPIMRTLATEFHIVPSEIKGLRCRKRRGRYAGRGVIYIEVVNPTTPDRILFEGYTEGREFVFLQRRE
jgi:hypothetical protein